MKYRVHITRDYWHEGWVEVEAKSAAGVRRKAIKQIGDVSMRIGGHGEGSDCTWEVCKIEESP